MPGPQVPSRSNTNLHRNQGIKPEKPSHGVNGPPPAPVKNDANMGPGPAPSKTK